MEAFPTAVVALVAALLGAAAVAVPPMFSASEPVPVLAHGERSYNLDIQATDLQVAPDAVWHAWTFNGTVPGPLLTVTAGETLRVTVTNHHSLMHSFHTHLNGDGLAEDGSQVNIITGIGMDGMIPPGGTYTYVFHPTRPGIFYYHCHSADGNHTISQHMAQGLYGVIVVKAPGEAPIRDEPIVMGERGFDVTGQGAPYFLMNGKGIPGGERTLERIFLEQGAAGVVAQFGVTVPMVKTNVGEPVRLDLLNIGDMPHTFHVHGNDMVSVDAFPGRIHPANVVQLLPGAADRVVVTPTHAGVWLFHCHVVSHADQGMIGVLVVEDPSAPASPSASPSVGAGGSESMGGMEGMGDGGGTPAGPAVPENGPPSLRLTVSTGSASDEFRFDPAELHATAGDIVQVLFRNLGASPHTFTLTDLGADTGQVAPGAEAVVTFQVPATGTFPYFCAIPGHRSLGMEGTLEVAAAA